ncbi:S8 family serine peptidase [candidate division KSB1 bacterium]|nr:S8 family serine peptidase [candidate division KSB1 bacterium]
MRKPLYFTLIVLLVIILSGSIQSPERALFVDDEILVKISPQITSSEIQGIFDTIDAVVLDMFPSIDVWRLKIADEYGLEEALQIIRELEPVIYAEPNYVIRASIQPNDPEFNRLWGLNNTGQTGGTVAADVRALAAWDVITGSSQVVIGIFDSGLDISHPDLQQNVYINQGEDAWADANDPGSGNQIDDDGNGYVDDRMGYNFVSNSNSPFDDNGHGTHVAGIAGAVGNNGAGIVGVNWRIKLLPIKILDAKGDGNVAMAIKAIDYAIKAGIKVVNCSWGGSGYSSALYDALALANTRGILFIAAAGNNGVNTDQLPEYPAGYDLPNIISVAATDHMDRRALWGDEEEEGSNDCGFSCSSVMAAVPGSNFGPQTVDLAAPGKEIFSTIPGSYGLLSGTSMATPFVTGAAGLLLAKRADLTSQQIKDQILNNVDPITAFTGLSVTGGRLNVVRALQNL